MGTNYYVEQNRCECCNRYDTTHHIGKSSWGWAFSFRGYKDENLTSWREWKAFLSDKSIVDEYGQSVGYDEFCHVIETVNAPDYVHSDGRKNLQHNEEGKKGPRPWFDPEYDWDDDQRYAFSLREFS
jgi:hypothetical protein